MLDIRLRVTFTVRVLLLKVPRGEDLPTKPMPAATGKTIHGA